MPFGNKRILKYLSQKTEMNEMINKTTTTNYNNYDFNNGNLLKESVNYNDEWNITNEYLYGQYASWCNNKVIWSKTTKSCSSDTQDPPYSTEVSMQYNTNGTLQYSKAYATADVEQANMTMTSFSNYDKFGNA